MQSTDYYQSHLDRVSRSFSFCIIKLDTPLRQWISLSYLLCRALDTIEDSPWKSAALRESQFNEFESFIHSEPGEIAVREWAGRFSKAIPNGEKLLLNDALFLFQDLHELPFPVRSYIRKTVLRMSAGMRHYDLNSAGELRLENLSEVNRYCYFVAGIVGELLTRLVLEAHIDFEPKPDLFKNAFHFGLFLQKVNLLKDQLSDEKEGRFLVPNRDLLFASLRENIQGSVDYITALPVNEKGFRIFCAWSLFLGAASLPWIQESFFQADGSKIPRSVTEELLKAIEEISQDDQALRAEIHSHMALLPTLEEFPDERRGPDWFHHIAGDVLNHRDFSELRLV